MHWGVAEGESVWAGLGEAGQLFHTPQIRELCSGPRARRSLATAEQSFLLSCKYPVSAVSGTHKADSCGSHCEEVDTELLFIYHMQF